MNTASIRRKMEPEEREMIEKSLVNSPSDSKRLVGGIKSALTTWGLSFLIFCICWLLLAWLVELVFESDYLKRSPNPGWILGVGANFCAVYALLSTEKWLKAWKDPRPNLKADLENGEVLEENLNISEIKRFQEPEHGGLIYFLRISDNRILVFFDQES